MDILYGDKLNQRVVLSNRIIGFSFFWTANVSSYIAICMIFMSEFAENMNLEIYFYKGVRLLGKIKQR